LILAKEDVLTVSRALELALFRDAKLDVSKVPGKMKAPVFSRGFQREANEFDLEWTLPRRSEANLNRASREEAKGVLHKRNQTSGLSDRKGLPNPQTSSISRPSGQWSDYDFDVLANGEVAGRVYKAKAAARPTLLARADEVIE
jgi:hypothetical protein